MKITSYSSIIFCFLLGSSCVSSKKYKTLYLEQQKLSNTLLQTKTDLASTQRQLYKIKNASSLSSETQHKKIEELNKKIKEKEVILQEKTLSLVNCEKDKQSYKVQSSQTSKSYQTKLKPLQNVQNQLIKQNKDLYAVQNKVQLAFAETANTPMQIILDKEELILEFDHKALFSSSGYSLSATGKKTMERLLTILTQEPRLLVSIVEQNYTSKEKTANWKATAKKTVILVTFLASKGIAVERLNGQFYSNTEAATINNIPKKNYTKIVLHYSNKHLLKLIPIK